MVTLKQLLKKKKKRKKKDNWPVTKQSSKSSWDIQYLHTELTHLSLSHGLINQLLTLSAPNGLLLLLPAERQPSQEWLKLLKLGPFHTARVMHASALILRAHPRKGILFTRRGPSQTNCYRFQWSLSHGANAGEMQHGHPFAWSSTRAHAKVQLLSMHIFTRAE